MFAISRTRWHTRPLSRRAKRRSSAAPGSLRKKYTGIVHPPEVVCSPNHSTTSGDHRKPVLHHRDNAPAAILVAVARVTIWRRPVARALGIVLTAVEFFAVIGHPPRLQKPWYMQPGRSS